MPRYAKYGFAYPSLPQKFMNELTYSYRRLPHWPRWNRRWGLDSTNLRVFTSVYRLGDLLYFGQLFKACANNYFAQSTHIFRKKIKGVKNFHFSSAIISGQLFIGLWWLFTGHPGLYNGSLILGHFLRTDATRSSPSSLRRSQRWDKGQDSLRLTSKNWTPFTNVRRKRKWSRRRSSPSRRAPMPIRMDFALLGKLI